MSDINKYLKFKGTSYVDCGNDNSLQFDNEVTAGAWFRTNCREGYKIIIGKGVKTGFWLDLYEGQIRLNVFNGGAQFWYPAGNKCFADNQWHFVAVWAKGSERGCIIDGSSYFTTGVAYVAETGNKLYIGRYSTTYFRGDIDNAFVYNRAISEGDANAIYALGRQGFGAGITGIFSDYLVAAYDMNESDGASITDLSGNGNTGTFAGSPLPSVEDDQYSELCKRNITSDPNYVYFPAGAISIKINNRGDKSGTVRQFPYGAPYVFTVHVRPGQKIDLPFVPGLTYPGFTLYTGGKGANLEATAFYGNRKLQVDKTTA